MVSGGLDRVNSHEVSGILALPHRRRSISHEVRGIAAFRLLLLSNVPVVRIGHGNGAPRESQPVEGSPDEKYHLARAARPEGVPGEREVFALDR